MPAAPSAPAPGPARPPSVPPAEEVGRDDAFVSYARADRAFVAERLLPALRERGMGVWVDLEDIPPAADWQARVWSGIDAARALVFVLSPDSAASRVCGEELRRAVELHKRIVPVLHRDVDPGRLPAALEAPNWVLLRDPVRGIEALVEALETDLEWRDAHARLDVRGATQAGTATSCCAAAPALPARRRVTVAGPYHR